MLVSHLRGDISRQLAMQDKMTIHLSCESESEVAKSFPTLCDPMDISLHPSSSVHGIFKARVLEWVAISFSR